MHILIAENNHDYQMIYANLLDRRHQVYFVSDGSQALQILLKKKIDLAILDYKMPKLSGIDILEYIIRYEIPISTALLISLQLPSSSELTAIKNEIGNRFQFLVAEKNADGLEQIKLLQAK